MDINQDTLDFGHDKMGNIWSINLILYS